MTRNLVIIGLLLGALLGGMSAKGDRTSIAPAEPAIRDANAAFVTRYCYAQYRGSSDVMHCLQALGL
jgi:hypothetical protein